MSAQELFFLCLSLHFHSADCLFSAFRSPKPTTGLDPETRRHIWRILSQEHSAGRTTVVTTRTKNSAIQPKILDSVSSCATDNFSHPGRNLDSMEEADALCTRIGIMAGGGLRCVGSQLYLKGRFGDG